MVDSRYLKLFSWVKIFMNGGQFYWSLRSQNSNLDCHFSVPFQITFFVLTFLINCYQIVIKITLTFCVTKNTHLSLYFHFPRLFFLFLHSFSWGVPKVESWQLTIYSGLFYKCLMVLSGILSFFFYWVLSVTFFILLHENIKSYCFLVVIFYIKLREQRPTADTWNVRKIQIVFWINVITNETQDKKTWKHTHARTEVK